MEPPQDSGVVVALGTATREAIRDDVFDDVMYPQILLRVGWAPINADPLPATPRRPLGELATWLDGSVLV